MFYNYNAEESSFQNFGFTKGFSFLEEMFTDGSFVKGRTGRPFYDANKEESNSFQVVLTSDCVCSRNPASWTEVSILRYYDVCIIEVPMEASMYIIDGSNGAHIIDKNGLRWRDAETLDGAPIDGEDMALDITFKNGEYVITPTEEGKIIIPQ